MICRSALTCPIWKLMIFVVNQGVRVFGNTHRGYDFLFRQSRPDEVDNWLQNTHDSSGLRSFSFRNQPGKWKRHHAYLWVHGLQLENQLLWNNHEFKQLQFEGKPVLNSGLYHTLGSGYMSPLAIWVDLCGFRWLANHFCRQLHRRWIWGLPRYLCFQFARGENW